MKIFFALLLNGASAGLSKLVKINFVCAGKIKLM